MSSDDDDYYYRRAEAQLEMAERTNLAAAVAAHCAIAEHYLERCDTERIVEKARASTDGLKAIAD